MAIYSPEYRQSWALIIGIDGYEDVSLPPLQTAVKGARAVAQLLQDEMGFDPARIVMLENEQATQRSIRRALTDPLSRRDKVMPDDRVLIYFAGHGVTFDTAEGEIGSIIPYDVEPGYIDTTIPMDELTRLANRIHAKHVLFLIDACFSGFATMREADAGVERQVADFLTRPVRQAIAAGTRDQAVSDLWGPGQHSLFTGFLLEGLRGAAPAPGGVLRAFHLAGYLQDEVATHSRSLQTPQYAALMGSRGGDFIFSVREVVELPQWLLGIAESDDATQRLMAIGQLRTLAQAGGDPDEAAQALAKLSEMAGGDLDTLVRSSAQAALRELMPETSVAPVEREEPVVIEPPPVEPEAPPLPQVTPVTPAKPARTGLPIWAIGALAVSVLLVIGLAVGGVFAPAAAHCRSAGLPEIACTSVKRNDEWTPYIQEFGGVQMALVPAGCFMMGSESGVGNEGPVHKVCFEEPFWIDKYEVTNEQYGSSGRWSGDDLPRESVDWFEAVAHCESRGARLPTEAEWEYAARGPDGLVYPWGNEFIGDYVVWGMSQTAHVGSKPDGASWIGALDMSGNVWEWVADWYDDGYYARSPRENPLGPESGDYRVLRGGSWYDFSADFLRAAYRAGFNPDYWVSYGGFRCALSY